MGQDHDQSADGVYDAVAPAVGFDGYDITDIPLGDLLRGERATMGKSLLDVERDLKIRAAYIAAIENGDIGAFSSPGFIAGYVRSYARYLGIDPEWSYRRFCAETGFCGVHDGTGQQGKAAKRAMAEMPRLVDPNDVISAGRISFAPSRESPFAGIEPGALGSAAVLIALVLGIGYGAWAVLHDIQRLQIAPIEQAPTPLAELDPLAAAQASSFAMAQEASITLPGLQEAPRIYRPQVLDAPILTPRDGALATLDPASVGAIGPASPAAPRLAPALAEIAAISAEDQAAAPPVQVTEAREDELTIFAVRPSWIRVSAASGETLFEGTLNRGDSYKVALGDETPPVLRSGNAGSVYFMVNGVTLGPAGTGASVVRAVALSADAVTASYPMANAAIDPDLPEVAALVIGASGGN
jgi:cytoskeletal protein RodZ